MKRQLLIERPKPNASAIKKMLPNITLFEDICPAEFPPSHAMIHNRHQEKVQHYEDTVSFQVRSWNRNRHNLDQESTDIPQLVTLNDNSVRFAIWETAKHYHTEASAWTDTEEVTGFGWVPPKNKNEPASVLPKDDYVGYTSWFLNNFGHFVHDHLPSISALKYFTPPNTKFILLDTPVTRRVLGFLDPNFVKKRVIFIEKDYVLGFQEGSTLTVMISNSLPNIGGCCRQFDFMRQWVAEKHPDRNEPNDRIILYYKRGGSSDTTHGRVLEQAHEHQVVEHIQQKMKQYNRPEQFAVFTGQWGGQTMSIASQYGMFRRATTIIGPHGSGIGGNFLWTYPYAKDCRDRVKLLEFIPGPESAQVQVQYATYFLNWRKWPLDYHSILYTKNSTVYTTYIDLQDLDDALDVMWGGKDISTT